MCCGKSPIESQHLSIPCGFVGYAGTGSVTHEVAANVTLQEVRWDSAERDAILAGFRGPMISRRTILFFLIAMTCFSVLTYRTWEQERPCREWKHNHAAGQAEPAPVRQPDGSFSVTLNPCNLWYAMAWLDRALALIGFASSVAFIISLIQDVLIWQRKRRSLIEAAPD
jgi:hypothetical protein